MNPIKSHYKNIVIGAWAGWLTCSLALATAEQDLLLIEANKIGGECTHTGCVPSKALISYAQDHLWVGLSEALKYVRQIRQHFVLEETPQAIQKKYHIDIVMWYARFVDRTSLIVNNQIITFDYCVIATGAQANIPEISGLDKHDYLTHENFFEYEWELSNLTIIGGGYVWCEIANACANLWVQVTIIQRNDNIIPNESLQAIKILHDDLVAKGVVIYTWADTTSVGSAHIIIRHLWKEISITHDQLLIATGKTPKLDWLYLDQAEVKYSDKGITVDHRNRTSTRNILAIGDCVADNPHFTHRADHEGINVFKYLYRRIIASRSYRQQVVPCTIYTDIQISRAGMSTSDITDRTRGSYVVITMPWDANHKSVITQNTVWYMTIIFTRLTGVIVGAEIVGRDTAEMLTLLTYLVQHEKRAYGVTSQIYQYPVRSHLIKKICGQYTIQTIQNIWSEIKRRLRTNSFKIIAWVFWLIILIAYFVIKSRLGLTNNEIGQQLLVFFSESKYGAILFIWLFAIRPLTFFPAVILTLMWGILFGPIWWVIYTFIGDNISASVAYWIWRLLGRSDTPYKKWIIPLIKSKMKWDWLLSVVLIRLVPINFDLINFSLGIIGVKYVPYLIGTAIGIIPAMTAVVLAGASLQGNTTLNFDNFSLNTSYLLIAIWLYIVSIGITFILRRKYKI